MDKTKKIISLDQQDKKLEIYEHGCLRDAKSARGEQSTIQDVTDFCSDRREKAKIPQWNRDDILERDKQFTIALKVFFENNILFVGQ